MTFPAALFTPLMVMLPAAGVADSRADAVAVSYDVVEEAAENQNYVPARTASDLPEERSAEATTFQTVVDALRIAEVNQVRIEQRMTIRVSPRPAPVRPNMLMDLPGGAMSAKMQERKMGKCVKVSGIAGVQPNGNNRLLLFMRDQRLVSAELERSCRSRDFYSGFYLSRSTDGQLCVDRDMLLSRSGANCKLSRMRQLVDDDE